MDVPAVSYITADDVQEHTQIAALAALADEDVESLIVAAEDQIDAYCGRQPHHPWDGNLDRVFPREQDFSIVVAAGVKREYPDTPVIPYNVSKACLRQVEFLYTQWWPNRTTAQMPTDYPVESHSIGGDGSFSETRARGGINFSEASLCDQAKLLLNGYVSRTAGITVTDVRTSVPPLRDAR